ncbi:putative peptidylprolyl isomerase [Helianthus annuus]|uniref:Peptidyl-prolyl cis-trans isomerase n=1 Tax=Helianthus annuus TaxID=4232 RepID=A0A251UZ26_HELAN|nr:peptidyl-prolyl cis-trans isomerase CYP21-4 [Helianthus annuus]XP_035844505.1 peptidyl-prolyl cis-trans isomerase CYP21-4 [Helianthus annuus]KAF5811024.1 putative peptidylprolyl isomerase [Helianthus annuus]KAJ0581751.1 putative peptidylprolyl isomerase [Helianthus annuus]KAJ0597715.1 putative peptidylprolyl isomerase [Helianthus annuus]KAJ0820179.1 putative peptidylprolyl isomerase [Helianthus annuus]KAJ0927737.1 putative peptidylprolyl isomerase [Helianthus annuus]
MARIKPQALLQQSKKKKAPRNISVPTIALYSVVTVVMVFFLFATYRHWSQRSIVQTEEGTSNFQVDDDFSDSKKSDVPRYAIFNTSKGLITVELYKEGSPEVVDEFIDACQKGHFKGMQFQRVVKHFVIQGGNSENQAVIEDWTSREKHYNQLEKRLKHEAFMLGTSTTKHEKEAFDIFITTAPIPDLNAKLNVFGRVIKGEDIVQEIEEVDTDEHYRPKSRIGIIEVTLKQSI